MSHVFGRSLKHTLPLAVSGDGVYIIDESGKRYLDASGGAAVSCLGHSDEKVKAAICDQVKQLAFAHTGFFTSRPAEQLADVLANAAPGDLNHVYFLSGGSEAIEAALKMTRQYHLETGGDNRHRFIARRQSYHGNTLGALAVGGNVARRKPFQDLLIETSLISPCYPYRDMRDGETLEQYGLRIADELETEILRQGAENVAGFIAETVGGATAGVLPPVPGYFKRIREICDQFGVVFILDEVMSGMGRAGTHFACEQDGVVPDVVCIAKGLGAGYQPVGATIVSDKIYDAFKNGSGAFQHGHTYMGHPVATAAALAVQRRILDDDLLANVRGQGEKLMSRLHGCFDNHANIGDIRGRGLFIGLELVRDKTTKQPFDVSLGLAAKIKAEAFARGLICYPGSGTADGVSGDHVLLAPPFIITDDQLDELVEKLSAAIDTAIERCGR